MVTCTLTVEIDNIQLTSLPLGIKLCIARDVNGVSNVIWTARALNMLSNVNTFKLTDEYQVFGASKFEAGALVELTSNPQSIQFGQKSTYSADGVMSRPVDDPAVVGNTFRVHNELNHAYIGVNGKKTDGGWSPIFVSPTPIVFQGDADFQPVDKITVFWSSSNSTASMISRTTGPSIEVDFTAESTQIISFTGEPGQGHFIPGPLPPPAA
ncbi:hypothetical protein CVT24_001086 [Panaeolus cyanescens]|uniref:Uncharacterized protein n=1 Tax=Panaeolus cyanescens TaxID=181874 RepID=A0A409YTI7_9AGAR|nr:hypothetical protein CVT24_001086 [Panaeolus cyanescens]